MRLSAALSALLCSVAFHVRAEAPADPVAWLQRIVAAGQKLDYTGIFVYQNGAHTETSRVIHVLDGGVEREKLEVLDGSPREVVRQDDEVRCFLPEERVVIVERQGGQKLLPARLPESLSGLTQYYELRRGKPGRVAGFDTQLMILEPRDRFRYGHWLWAEANTGLLLKARMVNAQGEAMEQFVFTQVQIGGNIDRDALKPRADRQSAEWRHQTSKATESLADNDEWIFRAEVPGFKRSAGVKREIGSANRAAAHYVFSDGMATVSVFIERMSDKDEASRAGQFRNGATSVFRRPIGEYLITAIGEVPPDTLATIASGIEPRRK